MAKMFYTMDETKAALGKSEDEIKSLAREGKLREFRDGPRLMFKADQVDSLKAELSGAGDQIGLSSGDTHTPLGLMDSKTGSGTGVGMKGDAAGAGTAAPGAGAGAGAAKEDTASGLDVGLSGSLSGSIGGGSLAGGSLGGSMGGMPSPGGSRMTNRPGVNVFGDDAEHVDPMAQTHITPPKDQISLEGVGSGSGLLDLTRETDDTSLGAALLDEISPGGSKKDKDKTAGGMVAIPSPSAGSSAGFTSISPVELPAESHVETGFAPVVPQVVEADDPVAPAFGLGSIAASIVILIAAVVLIGAITSDNPMLDARIPLAQSLAKTNIWIMFVVGLVFAAILFFVGIFVGKLGNKRTA